MRERREKERGGWWGKGPETKTGTVEERTNNKNYISRQQRFSLTFNNPTRTDF